MAVRMCSFSNTSWSSVQHDAPNDNKYDRGIAYLFWHCGYPTTPAEQYEEALLRFQQRECLIPCCGLANRPGYEDWAR